MAEDNRIEQLGGLFRYHCFQDSLRSQPWYLPKIKRSEHQNRTDICNLQNYGSAIELARNKLASGERIQLSHGLLERLSPAWNMTGYKLVQNARIKLAHPAWQVGILSLN